MADSKFIGNSAAFIAAVLFGASVVATRVAVASIAPLSLAFLRFGQGGLILLSSLLILRPSLLRVKFSDLPYLVLLGAILFAIFPVTFNVGLKFTEASRGALMLATLPLWSAWLANIAKSESLIWRQIGGTIFTFSAVAVVLAEKGLTWQGGAWALVGDLLMLLTAICGAFYGVLAQKMLTKYSAITVTTYAMLAGTCLLMPAAFIEGLSQAPTKIDFQVTILILFLGICGGALGYFLWTLALARLTPTQVAVYINLNPMVAAVSGAALLAEKLTVIFVAGFVAVLIGVLLVNWPTKIEAEPIPDTAS
ncbi:MAG: DMT family transporter [Desulfobacterales bacterium]|jgi:drug/metabolite transporter (DMT)-like permease